jgi:bifunctional DNA-binding transcriptional regulator/antitoxin component of YhaV-PrlF toxin-antitoxin module
MSTHSFALVIPKEIIKKFGWKERQKISIEEMPSKTLRLKDWKKK